MHGRKSELSCKVIRVWMQGECKVSLNCHQHAFWSAACRLPMYPLKRGKKCTDSRDDFTDILIKK